MRGLGVTAVFCFFSGLWLLRCSPYNYPLNGNFVFMCLCVIICCKNKEEEVGEKEKKQRKRERRKGEKGEGKKQSEGTSGLPSYQVGWSKSL